MSEKIEAINYPKTIPEFSINLMLDRMEMVHNAGGSGEPEFTYPGVPPIYTYERARFILHPETGEPVFYFLMDYGDKLPNLGCKYARITSVGKRPGIKLEGFHGYDNLMTRVILNYLLPKYKVVSSDQSQTHGGRVVWKSLISETLNSGKGFIYLVKTSEPYRVAEITSMQMYSNLERFMYGPKEKDKDTVLVISKKRLVTKGTSKVLTSCKLLK